MSIYRHSEFSPLESVESTCRFIIKDLMMLLGYDEKRLNLAPNVNEKHSQSLCSHFN